MVMRRRGGLERATLASASAAESSLLSEQQLGRLLRGEGTSGTQEPEWIRELRRVPGRLPPAPNSSTSDFRKVCSWLFALTFTDSSPLESLRVFLALALSACSKLFGLCVPLLFRRGIEQIELSQGSGGGTGLMDVAVIFMLSGVCRGLAAVCAELRSVTFQPVAQSAGRKVAIATYRHIMGLDIGFHLERNVGKLSRIVDRGTRSVAMVFRALLFTFIPTIIELVLVCVLLWRTFSPLCCATVLCTFTMYVSFTMHMSTRAAVIRKQVNYIDNLCSGKVVESFMNVDTVKNFDNIGVETKGYNGLLVDYQLESQRSEKNSAALNAGQALILAAGSTAVLLIVIATAGTAGASRGMLSATLVGGIVMANGLLLQVSAPLQFLGFFYRELRQSLVDINDIFDILNTKTKVPEGERSLAATRISEADERGQKDMDSIRAPMADDGHGGVEVSVDNVWFSYAGREPVLRGVSVHARRGESIALVGPSGSGKSTLLKLIMRQYDADDGSILLDGVDVKELTNQSMRDAIGVVPQDSALFTGTLESNIQYGTSRERMRRRAAREAGDDGGGGDDENDDEEEEDEEVDGEYRDAVLAAVRLSQLDRVIDDAPAGMQTVVGERGFKLSGGERQRVALARVFLREPRLLLCDEATSALDSKTENQILHAIRAIADGRTAITVAHRLSTIIDADRIYCMRNGVVEEFGTHAELLAMRAENNGGGDASAIAPRSFTGLYAELWELQKKEEDEPVTVS